MKKIALSIFATSLILASCGGGGSNSDVDGGYFGEVPAILIKQAEQEAQVKEKFKEAKSEDDLVKLNAEQKQAEDEYEKSLKEVLPKLEAIDVPVTIGNGDYELADKPVMNVRRFSSSSCLAVLKFALKTTKEVPNNVISSYSIYHEVFVKIVDKDGNVLHTRQFSTSKIDGKELGKTLHAGAVVPCEISINLSAKAEEADGKTIFDVPVRKMDKIVIISKEEFNNLQKN